MPAAPSTAAPSTAAPAPEPELPGAAPDPAPEVVGGDVVWLQDPGDHEGDGSPALLLPIDPLPQPEGPVIASFELHNSFRLVRAIDEVLPPEHVVIVSSYPEPRTCTPRITRTRRIHTLFVYYDGSFNGESEPADPQSYLAIEFTGCEGGAGITGVPASEVRVRSLRADALSEPATPALIDAVRHVDDGVWGGERTPSGAFRMLDLPAHGVTIVVGTAGWVVRDGLVLFGAEPVALIEAGPAIFFDVQTPSEGWFTSLAAGFVPSHVPVECEVIDDSGTAMNVRAGARGNAPVVTTVPVGTRVVANDTNESWFHLATDPPGWAHARGLRCPTLPPDPRTTAPEIE